MDASKIAMTRAAIYARYSSELQSNRSIEDQVALCRDYAGRHGFTVVETYADYAVSGSSVHGRFAFERMVADAKAGRFDLILAEDLDRLSRNQSDIAALYERMGFVEVKLFTVADGEINEMHIGLKGTMSAMFISTLKLKIHRGQAGRVRAGKIPGGLCYGYKVTEIGERTIIEQEASIIRRIFQDTISGLTPRDIAAALNRESVPAPRRGLWNASTIHGSRKRRNGILRQELYAGRLVWNRQRMIKNPDTGKRVTRVNADEALHHAEVPELRIIDDVTWKAVQAMLAAKGGPQAQVRRKSPHIFSGLLKCGLCGRSYVSHGGGLYPRFRCSSRAESGSCGNTRMISARIVETRVLAAIEAELLDDRVIEAALAEYAAERRRLNASRDRRRREREKRLAEIDRALRRVWAAIEDGSAEPREGAGRVNALAAERKALRAEAPESTVLTLHPGLPARYRALVRDLRAGLASRPAERKAEVLAGVRSLVQKIVIYPHDDARGRDLELVGELAGLLGSPADARFSGRKLVAEEGFKRPPTPSYPVQIAIRSR